MYNHKKEVNMSRTIVENAKNMQEGVDGKKNPEYTDSIESSMTFEELQELQRDLQGGVVSVNDLSMTPQELEELKKEEPKNIQQGIESSMTFEELVVY